MKTLQADIDILKIEIEYILGRKIITSKDCIDLADDIFKKTGLLVSANTLRRCFGLVKSVYPSSQGTLNILAIYTGFTSFEELIKYKRSSQKFDKKEDIKLLKYFSVVFQNVTVQNAKDPTFIKLTHATIDFLNQHTDIAYEFQKVIVKTNNGKRFYFEHFVNIDKLNSFYGDGLRYYLAENKGDDAQIFGHSLLCFRYCLTMDTHNLKYHYHKLADFKISCETPALIAARYFAAKIFTAQVITTDLSNTILEAAEYYNCAKKNTEQNNMLFHFDVIFSEALILTRHYTETAAHITNSLARYTLNTPHINNDYLNSIKLLQAAAFANIGCEKKAIELFEQINPLEFYFIKKQFYTLLYTILGIKLKKIKQNENQINFLMEETGFAKLANLFY